MLTTAAVRPLEEFFEFAQRPIPKKLKPTKETAVSINRGSILCLCDAPKGHAPRILRSFRVEQINLIQGPQDSVRWTITDDTNQWFDGSSGKVDLYQGLLWAYPTSPLKHKPSPYGERFVFHFKLPSRYRIHHLAYLKKYFPSSVAKLRAV